MFPFGLKQKKKNNFLTNNIYDESPPLHFSCASNEISFTNDQIFYRFTFICCILYGKNTLALLFSYCFLISLSVVTELYL